MLQIPQCLENRIKKAVETFKPCRFVRVISHYDADGVSSASIIYNTLINEGKQFHISFIKDISPENVKSLIQGEFDCIILTDVGSSLVSLLENYKNVIILDHHPPEKDSENLIHVNPHFCNMSGTSDACGATLSYLFSIYVNEENWKNYPSYFAGVIGDRQHINGYSGLNRNIVEYIENKGIKKINDISLDGPTVKDMLLLATDPFIMDYTGNEENVLNLLNSLGIDPHINPSDLTEENKTNLYSWIALKLLSLDIESDIIQGTITEKHIIPSLNIYDITLSSYVDAVARMNKQGLALSFLVGNLEKLNEVLDVWTEYKKVLINELYNGLKNKIEMNNIQYLFVNEESIAGAVSGILMSYALNRNKPVFAIHDSNGEVHISGRATKALVSKGINLGSVMRKCASECNGSGGGHNIAAGATIQKDCVKKFLQCVDKNII